jgi:hypothetical protein
MYALKRLSPLQKWNMRALSSAACIALLWIAGADYASEMSPEHSGTQTTGSRLCSNSPLKNCTRAGRREGCQIQLEVHDLLNRNPR